VIRAFRTKKPIEADRRMYEIRISRGFNGFKEANKSSIPFPRGSPRERTIQSPRELRNWLAPRDASLSEAADNESISCATKHPAAMISGDDIIRSVAEHAEAERRREFANRQK